MAKVTTSKTPVTNIASSSNGGASLPHTEAKKEPDGWDNGPAIIIPDLPTTKKPPVGPVPVPGTFVYKHTGWAGQDGAPPGR